MKVDLLKTYNKYLSNFDGKTAVITTGFIPLDCFYIKFDILQLPHLLGLHKIYKHPPKKICQDISCEKITYNKIQRNKKFGLIKDRIHLFEFILEIFLEDYNGSVVYVSEKDKRNSMCLDIAFNHPYKSKILTLGLRETDSKVYAPVTFYATNKNKQPFTCSKRAKILTLNMIHSNFVWN